MTLFENINRGIANKKEIANATRKYLEQVKEDIARNQQSVDLNKATASIRDALFKGYNMSLKQWAKMRPQVEKELRVAMLMQTSQGKRLDLLSQKKLLATKESPRGLGVIRNGVKKFAEHFGLKKKEVKSFLVALVGYLGPKSLMGKAIEGIFKLKKNKPKPKPNSNKDNSNKNRPAPNKRKPENKNKNTELLALKKNVTDQFKAKGFYINQTDINANYSVEWVRQMLEIAGKPKSYLKRLQSTIEGKEVKDFGFTMNDFELRKLSPRDLNRLLWYIKKNKSFDKNPSRIRSFIDRAQVDLGKAMKEFEPKPKVDVNKKRPADNLYAKIPEFKRAAEKYGYSLDESSAKRDIRFLLRLSSDFKKISTEGIGRYLVPRFQKNGKTYVGRVPVLCSTLKNILPKSDRGFKLPLRYLGLAVAGKEVNRGIIAALKTKFKNKPFKQVDRFITKAIATRSQKKIQALATRYSNNENTKKTT